MIKKGSFLLIVLLSSFSCSDKAISNCQENIQEDCLCTMQWEPVCGCNNKTYGNACEAECSGIKHYKPGECP